MPNRVLKESIKRSEQIDSLTWFEEVVFYRLILTADDYGCVDGRIVLLKNDLFPLRENVTRKSIENAISKLASVGLLQQYTVNGTPYLFFPTWEKHQRIRNKRPKYPLPSQADLTDICQSNDSQTTAECPSESESESESKSESESESESETSCGCSFSDTEDLINNTQKPRAESTENHHGQDKMTYGDGTDRLTGKFESMGAKTNPVSYAEICGIAITPRKMQEFKGYMEDLPDDVIIHAIDIAVSNGAKAYVYLQKILDRYITEEVHDLASAEIADKKFVNERRAANAAERRNRTLPANSPQRVPEDTRKALSELRQNHF